MTAVLSTLAGRSDSLLQTEFFAAVRDVLGEVDVIQATAVDEPVGFDPAALMLTPEAIEAMLADTVLLQPYEGIVIADVDDGEQPHTKVFLVHADEAAAETNADLVEQALAEGIDVTTQQPIAEELPGAEVTTAGPVVVVNLPFEGAYPKAVRMLVQRSLFPTG
jgi:hypothetical protein